MREKQKILKPNFKDLDLSDSIRSGVAKDLSSIDLSHAILYDAMLPRVILSGANLSEAALTGAMLLGTDLRDGDLSNADLSNADLSGADLAGAKLCSSIIISKRYHKSKTRFRDADFNNAIVAKFISNEDSSKRNTPPKQDLSELMSALYAKGSPIDANDRDQLKRKLQEKELEPSKTIILII